MKTLIVCCIINIIGAIASVIFIENGYVTLGAIISINCFFFAITSRIMICNLPQAEDVDELKYKMINLQAKLDYIIEREYERGVCRVCACRNYRKIIRNI